MDKLSYDGPIVLAILDGVGLAPDSPGNAVSRARTLWLGTAAHNYLSVPLRASGEAVGLLPGQTGNSEVGHNTMGSGQVIRQGIAHIEEAFDNGEIFESEAWQGALNQVLDNGNRTLHFAGIFSDGGVHSHVAHLEQMVAQAYMSGVRRIRVHAVFDGRDVPPQSEPKFIRRFEEFAAKLTDADVRIASGGGRMVCVSDRYENDWSMVERGWKMMVDGEAEYYFQSAEEAIESFRTANPDVQDQNLPAFVIVDENKEPVGQIRKNDAVIYFDFRADRAIEIAQAFTYVDFPYFDRGDYHPDDIYFVGMTEYNSDTHVPEHRLVEPVKAGKTLSRFLDEHEITQLACSETVKFGHVTYYFNGNSYDKANSEEFIEIDSYAGSFEERPWMQSAEIADAVIENMPKYKFVRLNFPGGDMVGHTANVEATLVAMEAIDLSLARIAKKVDELGGCLIVVADHGNAEELIDAEGNPKTSHTTNEVPCIIYDNTKNRTHYELNDVTNPGLANLAATISTLLGIDNYPESWSEPLIRIKN